VVETLVSSDAGIIHSDVEGNILHEKVADVHGVTSPQVIQEENKK
jgi:hypothetical protein